jgi:hypothetical protein
LLDAIDCFYTCVYSKFLAMQVPDDTLQLGPHLFGVQSQNLVELVAGAE